jgi:hypothetical protein
LWYIGVPSKATVEGYSKGFLDAVNSSDQEFEEWDLAFVGELRADSRSDIPLKNHRGYWWRGAVRLLDEAELDEETRAALCKVAEVSKKITAKNTGISTARTTGISCAHNSGVLYISF